MSMTTTPATLTIGDDVTRRRHADSLARLIRGEVRFDQHNRMLYSTDASIYQVEPIGVVIPADTEDAAAALAYCREHGLPVLPRGGGTSLAGQCTNHAVVFDFSASCTKLFGVNAVARSCNVEPGITIDDLNDQLRAGGHDLFFAPDPATARQCNIGGAIGNNAAGTRSILYGRTSENIEAIDVLLASGEHATLAKGSATQDPVARRHAQGVVDIVQRYEPLIRQRFPKTLRRNAGYALDMMLADIDEARAKGVSPLETINLAHLICGSEGTLAITTGATLKLHPVPKAKGLAVLGFNSLEGAIDAVIPFLALRSSAVELLDDMVIGLARENLEYQHYVKLMPQPREGRLEAVLYVEFFSTSGPDEIQAKFAQLRDVAARACPGAAIAAYTGATEMGQALKLRKAGEPLLHGIPGARKPLGFVEDNAVPVEHLAEFVRKFRAIIDEHGTRAAFWAHASVGVLHVRPLLDPRDPVYRTHMEEIATEVADLAQSLGGVMSGEHGDGRVRGPLLERYFGTELMQAFREVKQLFDPQNLLNPGNIVSPGPIQSIHENLRVRPKGANVNHPHVDTYFDYTQEAGFDHAVELCNGSGVCRKKQGGTMCPSYMATLDERHSTRGRGNALRLAITGQLNPPDSPLATRDSRPAWNDPDTLETLNLCLSCKGCKTECPTNVDIAQYKAEYLAQGYRASGEIPLKARVFGNVRLLNRLGSAFAPLSNWMAELSPSRWLANRVLGLAPQRSLPAFAPSLFRFAKREFADARWSASGALKTLLIGPTENDEPIVVLYSDCFTTWNDPRIGIATIKSLRAFGYSVAIPHTPCCGRPQTSVGLLEDASSTSSQALMVLSEVGSLLDAKAIVVAEPSCLSAVKDEWLKFKRLNFNTAGKETAADANTLPTLESLQFVSAHSFLPEDFLDKHWDTHPKRPAFTKPVGLVALHAHCHQKALWGAETSAKLLRRVVGDKLRVLDTGCCGMAGSFGYTADRYDLSMQIGELALFPAVRELGPNDTIVAPGTSCRHQIHDGTQRTALHPMELIAQLIS